MELKSNRYVLTPSDEESKYLEKTFILLNDLCDKLQERDLNLKHYNSNLLPRITEFLHELLYEGGVVII